MFSSRYISIFYTTIVFIFVFSIYNDNFIVDRLGDNSLKFLFLAFTLLNAVRIYKNFTDRKVIEGMIPFLIFAGLLLIFMIINPSSGGILSEKSIAGYLLIISLIIIVSFFISFDFTLTLYAIWSALIISSIISFFNEPISEWTFRKTGGTGDPNEFASQMISFLFISLFLYKKNRNIYFLAVSILAFSYSILYAASMSSFLVLGVLAVLILLRFIIISFKKNKLQKRLIISSAFILALLINAFIFQENLRNIKIVDKVLGRTENLRTANTRIRNWKAGIKMVIDKPLTGVGFGEYAANSNEYSRRHLRKDAIAPHNIYIHILAESGVFTFSAFAFFLYILLSRHFKRIIHSDYFWIYLAVLGYLLMGFTLGFTYSKFLWLMFALLMNIQYKLQSEIFSNNKQTKDLSSLTVDNYS